ncbi:hypothetical protein TELCIR_12409 [Teladorsagia circumcincta]|uniref:Beta-lactamase-related domain-containing protein n=1 Tax=Teladorsagia circumcincta TaxID=45464 RepID=A0A2G9U6M5_TELCI|nr:hypothetical protein TELCIR_12409 [Teladorsagia circumcincta]
MPLAAREFVYDRKIAVIGAKSMNPRGYFDKGVKNMRRFGRDFTLYNNPETRMAGQPGVNGVATARGLAYLYQLTMDGTLLSAEARKGSWQFGHMGIGGQSIRGDPTNDLVLCYLTNAMKAGIGEHTFTFNRLQKKVYEILKQHNFNSITEQLQ